MKQTFKKGDKVVFISDMRHQIEPKWYPPVDTVGTVVHTEDDLYAMVQWPRGTTSGDDLWWAEMSILMTAPSMFRSVWDKLTIIFRRHKKGRN